MNAQLQSFTPEELLDRHGYIGGSDSAAAIGLNKYHSTFDLWQEKCGLVPSFQGNEATLWGKLHEPVVRQQVAERTGRVIRLPTETIFHPKHKFIGCHPDGVMDGRRLYEGKTARFADGFGDEGTDQVPEHYLVQVQHNMMVCDLDVCDLGVLIGGSELRLYEIPADKNMQQLILDAEQRFWTMVLAKIPPPPDTGREDAIEVLKRMYPGTDGKSIEADDALNTVAEDLKAQKLIVKNAEGLVTEMKAKLLAAMGNATYLTLKDGSKYRRALVERKAYDVKASSYMDFRALK